MMADNTTARTDKNSGYKSLPYDMNYVEGLVVKIHLKCSY